MCTSENTIPTAPASTWPDRLGIWASGLCVVHCLLTPLLLSASAVLAHLLPSEERVHRGLALFITLLGAVALLRGFRTHRRVRVFCLMTAGLAGIYYAAYAGDHLPSHAYEVAITLAGSVCMIAAHRLNHTFCKACACSRP